MSVRLRYEQGAHDIARVNKVSGALSNRDLVWTEFAGKLLGFGGCPIVDNKRESGEGVCQVSGYRISDGTQSVNSDTMAMIRGCWTRVRQSGFLVFRDEKGGGHFAILSDDLVNVQVLVSRAKRVNRERELSREVKTLEILSTHRTHRPPSSQPMAHPIPTYAQPHGTLAPGQTISVNKYTVQVERYLSQGELYRLNCDRPFGSTTADQPQPNHRRLCSRLPRTDFGTGLWDNTSCFEEDRCRKRFNVDRGKEGG